MSTSTSGAVPEGSNPHRYRLRRAGVLNVWQYDEQVFDIDGGRLLLRGTNGAGKSKTLEMLLPFVLDGDKLRMTASGRHHTSLTWLMLDGYDEGSTRTGYVWVEFERLREDGGREHLTCGIGIRASVSAKQVITWHFLTDRRVGHDLHLEDDAGPLLQPRLEAQIGASNVMKVREYREQVGRTLFGLDPARYAELLRLLYWLRQPQVGEDIDPQRLAGQLVQALPEVDDSAIRSAGDTFDQLQAFGEQIDRRGRTAEAVDRFGRTYTSYVRGRLAELGHDLVAAHDEYRRRRREATRLGTELGTVTSDRDEIERRRHAADTEAVSVGDRLSDLRAGPEARSEQALLSLTATVGERRAAADLARSIAVPARARADDARARADHDLEQLAAQAKAQHRDWTRTTGLMTRSGWQDGPAVGHVPSARDRAGAGQLEQWLAGVDGIVREEEGRLGRLVAAVETVDAARRDHDVARAEARRQEDRTAEAAQSHELAVSRREEARTGSDDLAEHLASDLATWAALAPGFEVPVPRPAQDDVLRLASLASLVASPHRAAGAQVVAQRVAGLAQLEQERSEQQELRRQVGSELDPRPVAPAVRRGDRGDVPGAPLWRLVDFAESLDAAARAGLEAALEGAGLLDAWVRPDGQVLDEREDVVVASGPPGGDLTGTLAEVLLPDRPPPGCEVEAAVVHAVLARIGLGGPNPDLAMSVSTDGRWWVGDLAGRTGKDAAQYVGAGARAAERRRRLAVIDAALAEIDSAAIRLTAERDQARQSVQAVDDWVAAVPDGGPLARAWSRLDALTSVTDETQVRMTEAERAAEAARTTAARLRGDLDRLASTHGLPVDRDGLDGHRTRLASIRTALVEHRRSARTLGATLTRWVADDDRARADAAEAEQREAELAAASDQHVRVAERLAELAAAVGSEVTALRARLAVLQDRQAELVGVLERLADEQEQAVRRLGALEAEVRLAGERVGEARGPLTRAGEALAAAIAVPGALDAATGEPALDAAHRQALSGLVAEVGMDEPRLARATREAAEILVEQASLGTVSVTRMLDGWRDLLAGPGAEAQPRLLEMAGLYLVTGRDDGGEHPIVVLGPRLRSALEHDRALLSDRERRMFEEHVLGDLGQALRERRREASELVRAMNQQLDRVSTSQGIRVRLSWKLRDDVPADARRAVSLLGERVDALLPQERHELRDALHRLIEASRAEAPEDSYTEHLARALDYRQWYEFRITYLRPEGGGTWLDLRRKSPLSQGEQKVVCYLPLFAAAAAHYTNRAGAAANAPRLILLDDAFPKIDARTHPKLFGLLVELDLDFVVTSERLWGDHDTVPSLAIYEALRDPGQRGIAQYHHRWDGRRLHAVGG